MVAPSHPVYGGMIKPAIKELEDREDASIQAILKFIVQKYKFGDNEKQINTRLRVALKREMKSGLLTHATGTGSAERFRLAEKSGHEAAPKVAKKPKAKSKAAAKVDVHVPAADKEAKKEKSSSPKKTTRPKAKSPKSPRKVAVVKKAGVKTKTPKKSRKAAATKA